MRHHSRTLALLGVLNLAVLVTPLAGKAETPASGGEPGAFSTEIGLDVATGKYGNATSTTTVSLPVSLLYFPTARLDLGLSIPFIRQNNDLVVDGRPVRSRQAPPPRGMAARQGGPVCGIGDLVLSAGYTLLPETDRAPQLHSILAVKCPTADSKLGTGAFDESLGLGLTKSLGNWYLFLFADYTLQGKTSLFTARDFADGECGAGYEVLPGLRPSLGVKGVSSMEANVGGTLQAEGKLVYAATRAIDLKLYLDRGLTVSSATWEGGCFLAYNF